VVVLHYIEDLRQADVAARLGITEGTVAATLHQARARLAGLLADEPDPADHDAHTDGAPL
jgi:DNA-directed RNA polymerase specialized sigma24 family protein